MFLMDIRKSDGNAASNIAEKEKIYSKSNKMTCISSNTGGNVAVGN